MTAPAVTFTALAADAAAEEVAKRIHDTVAVIPGATEIYHREFARVLTERKIGHAEASAKTWLKETLEAAEGKRKIGIHLRRFLTNRGVREVIAQQFPAYHDAKLKENGAKVAQAVNAPTTDTDMPEKASFRKAKPAP